MIDLRGCMEDTKLFVAAQCDFKVLSSLLDQRDYDETMSQDTAGPSSSGYDEVM
jgi:hypothetical protein